MSDVTYTYLTRSTPQGRWLLRWDGLATAEVYRGAARWEQRDDLAETLVLSGGAGYVDEAIVSDQGEIEQIMRAIDAQTATRNAA